MCGLGGCDGVGGYGGVVGWMWCCSLGGCYVIWFG